jgi:glutamate decarboxylase
MAPHSDKMKMMRIVVREDFSKSRCDALIADFKLALQTLDAMDAKKLQEHKEYVQTLLLEIQTNTYLSRHATQMKRRSTMIGHLQKMPTNPFSDEKHSLQGKTGKTHGVC